MELYWFVSLRMGFAWMGLDVYRVRLDLFWCARFVWSRIDLSQICMGLDWFVQDLYGFALGSSDKCSAKHVITSHTKG